MSTAAITPSDVIEFWRSAGEDKWFAKDDAFDRTIKERFGPLHAEAALGRHDAWAKTPDGALALVLLFDQFSRNLFRGSAKTFAQDQKALELARDAIDAGSDERVDPAVRKFFYMPFMHSESLADQDRCISLSHAIGDMGTLRYAREHREIVRRFGRFPHRNTILQRHTTPSEQAFLDGGGFAG